MLYAPYGAVTEQKFATMARKFIPENLLTIDFWEIFLNKCVPLEKGQSEYKYYENEDSGKYLYKSIKQRAIVTYDHHSGQLRIGTFGGD